MINAYWENLNFRIQERKAEDWQCVADTGMPSPSDFFEVGQEKALNSLSYVVKPRSIVVLLRRASLQARMPTK